MATTKETDYFDYHYKIASYFLLIPPQNKTLRLFYWIVAIPHLILICSIPFLAATKLLLGGSGDFSLDMLTLGAMFLEWMGVSRVAKWPFHKKDFDALLEKVRKLNSDNFIFDAGAHHLAKYRSFKLNETKKLCFILYLGALSHLILNIIITNIMNYCLEPVYETWNPSLNRTQTFRDYAYPLWYPFDISISDGYYWIGFFYQPFSYFFLFGGFFCVDLLCLNIIIHLTCHVNILGHTFKFVDKNVDCNLDYSKVINLKEKRIIKCIKELQGIYNCATDLNDIITMQMLFQQFYLGVTMCCVVYRASSVSVGNELGYLLSVTIAVLCETFINSWFYQSFTLELFKLLDVIYDLDWINYPPKLRKLLIFSLRRLQKPFYFTMGYWQPLNNDVCIWTIKTSYSFYTLLTRVK